LKTRIHCKVTLSFEKEGRIKEYHQSFASDFLDERPLGMAFLYCNESLEKLFDFILKVLPDKEHYIVKDAMYDG
jgi:hypothetical protein